MSNTENLFIKIAEKIKNERTLRGWSQEKACTKSKHKSADNRNNRTINKQAFGNDSGANRRRTRHEAV